MAVPLFTESRSCLGGDNASTTNAVTIANSALALLARVSAWAIITSSIVPVSAADAGKDGLDGGVVIKSQEAVVDVPIVSGTSRVAWAKTPIRVDGELSDWAKNAIETAVVMEGDRHASWLAGRYGGPTDLSASLRLARDDHFLYLALEIRDDAPPAPDSVTVAIAPANNPLLVGWRDVGQRVKPDDVILRFTLGADDVAVRFDHLQARMDYSVVEHAFGNDVERRAFLDEIGAGVETGFDEKIFSKMSRESVGEKSHTRMEAAIPWKNLMPYDPVSYGPLKINLVVHDSDAAETGDRRGMVGWMPGLHQTYSAAHFADLDFDKPEGRDTIDPYGQLLTFHYLDAPIAPIFSFFNHGEPCEAKLELFDRAELSQPLAAVNITIPAGHSENKAVSLPSESIKAREVGFMGRLTIPGRPPIDIPVHTPRFDNTITIQPVAEVEASVARLQANIVTLSGLYDRVKAANLNTAYPRAYLTLQEMFVERCRMDMGNRDSARVLRNTAYLDRMFEEHKAYMEEILRNPQAQLADPPRFALEDLSMKDGYWWARGKPVFLWGPCVFWFLRHQQPLVGELGFNSVCTEIPWTASEADISAHMNRWKEMGVSVNAHMHVPDLQLTGADIRASELLKEHPEIKNLDPNNFLPFLIQHPIARKKIEEGFAKSIAFWRPFSDVVRSYWLWNEPYYQNYSEQTRQDFISRYLKPRYRTIDALNARWKTAYKGFDEIQLIKWPDPANSAPWYDFQQFRDDLLVDFFGFLNTVAKGIDPSKPTHTKFMAASLHAFSMERLQSLYDIAGHDGNNSDRDVLFMDLCSSLYPEKPLSDTEVHIAYMDRKTVDLVAWRLALHGLADGNWWSWHTNHNFTNSLGSAESMYGLTLSGLDVQRLMDPYIIALNRKQRPVATLFPDVVERRSDLSMVRRRFEMAPAQYHLGIHPFYATETRIAEGELTRRKLLVAGESDFVKDSTYAAVLDYVKNGGTVIVTRGGFAHNEYGDPRDAGELVRPEGGEKFGADARAYPLGKGRVICIDTVPSPRDVVKDGGQCMRLGTDPENLQRQRAYQRVLARAIEECGLGSAVRLVATADAATGDEADAALIRGIDWRVADVDGGHVLCALPYAVSPPDGITLVTDRPIKKIVNLITQKEVAVKDFSLADGPNLFFIELQ